MAISLSHDTATYCTDILVGVEDARFAVQTIKEKKTERREGKRKKKNRGGVA
jgi:hypothetical protein